MEKPIQAFWIVFSLSTVATSPCASPPTSFDRPAANAFQLPITASLLMIVCNDKNFMQIRELC
jgi:hypothetical protein